MIPFSYDLPAERIAQRPCYPYDQAKLLSVNRKTAAISDLKFVDLADVLAADDFLVFNDSKVIQARLFGKKVSTGAKVEILLLRELSPNMWQALAKPKKRINEGDEIEFSDGLAVVKELGVGPEVTVELQFDNDIDSFLSNSGVMPIPPYIRKGQADKEDVKDYQTIFGKRAGSVAAPTASLHFTPELLSALESRGVEKGFVTLHVGAASFMPVVDDETGKINSPASEYFCITKEQGEKILQAKSAGKRIIAVGTTVVRALETWAGNDIVDDLLPTDLFISPGFEWSICDGLITNFHQPGTTHMLLVESFLGRELLATSYEHALGADYRFLSYGDGMIIL